MSGPLSKIGRLGLLLVFAAASFVVLYFYFHRGGYQPPATVQLPVGEIAIPSSSLRAFEELPLIQDGTVLVDGVHGNFFNKSELTALLDRVADRGYDVEILGESRPGGGFGSFDLRNRLPLLEEKLRQADSLVVVQPTSAYSPAEADLIERYIFRKGGKLLLIADPTRSHNINSLSERFGITFQPDYLYNDVDYNLNFQNVYIRSFREDDVTEGLSEIVLYTAGSIKSTGPGLAFTGSNTRSSLRTQPDPFQTMVKAGDGRVLALSDLTFMVPPRNSNLDNDRLISNIADFLTSSQRSFDLADFPGFFEDDVDILMGRSSLFDAAAYLKIMLLEFRIQAEIQAVEDITKDTVYIGLYEDSADVAQYLAGAGLGIEEDVLRTRFTTDIEKEGTAIILLHAGHDRHALVVLGDSERSLLKAMSLLSSGEFKNGLAGDFVGVYRTE